MTTPFFSVVIPTKNRPELLKDAIKSVLLQDFGDYELVVSDNFNDEKTKKTVDEFAHDRRLKYFRTKSELNMPEHWEFAGRKAKGEYVLFLTDRSLFRKGTLKRIYDVVQKYSPQGIGVYTWQHSIFDRASGLVRSVAEPRGIVEVLSSKELRKEYAGRQEADWRFPVVLNGCCSSKLVAAIRKNHKKMFFPISPDTVGGFLLLFYSRNIVVISEPLFLMQVAENSTGVVRDASGPEFYLRTLNMPDWYRYVPVKAPFNHNWGLDDFLAVRAIVGKEPIFADVDWVNYFLGCYENFIYFGQSGFIKNRRAEFLEAWEKAFQTFPPEVQAEVRRRLPWRRLKFTLKARLRGSRWLPFLRRAQGWFLYGTGATRYASALHAAGFGERG